MPRPCRRNSTLGGAQESRLASPLQAQDNIIELNKSRLRALEELKAARQKIAELGALRCCCARLCCAVLLCTPALGGTMLERNLLGGAVLCTFSMQVRQGIAELGALCVLRVLPLHC